MKKVLATITATAMLICGLTACSSPAPADTAATPADTTAATEEAAAAPEENSDAKSFDGVTITLAASQNWVKDIDRELAEEFKAETGITVDFQLSPDDQYQTIIKSKLNSGEGADIFMSYSGSKLRDFNPETNMVDLSGESWVSGMKPWAIAGSSYNGKVYAFNTCSADGTNGVLYQPEMFEQYGIKVPTNYEEFKTACDTLAENGITPVYELVKDLWHAHYWMEGVATKAYARDPELVNKLNSNELGFADVPEFVTAIEQVNEMASSNYFGENHMSNTYDKSYEAIASGQYGMIIIHSSYPNELAQNITGTDPDKFSMFANPLADNTGITLTAGGPTRCINAKSANIDACKAYFEFLARPEIAQKLYDARTEFMEASINGVNGTPTIANQAINAVSQREQGPEAVVYFYDGGKISELMQEMFVGALTPQQLLEEFDNYRRSIAKDAGIEGF